MKVKISVPSLGHTNTWCQILQGLSPEKGLSGGTDTIYRQPGVITANATFTFSHYTSGHVNSSKAYWWVIENTVRLVRWLIKKPPKNFWLLSCSVVGWQRLPVAFQEARFPICSYMFWRGLCSVGCQEWHEDNKLGLRREWGLSKLCCIRSNEESQTLTTRAK